MTHQHVDRVAVLECENTELKSRLSKSEQRAMDLEVRVENAEAAATYFEGEKNALESNLAQMTKERDAAIQAEHDLTGRYNHLVFEKERMGAQLAAAQREKEGAEHEFKNFHRLLCDRFKYAHDEMDWERDQLSLIEHIAALSAAPLAPPVDRYREALKIVKEQTADAGCWFMAITASEAYLQQELRRLHAAIEGETVLAHPSEGGKEAGKCVWEDREDGPWETGCGHSFEFTTDGPKENGFKFCCYCGDALETKPRGEAEWADRG